MTDLTDKWKKGELPTTWYYTKLWKGCNVIDKFIGNQFLRYDDSDILEVLAPVPSYEEWQALLSDQLAKNEGVEINAELEKDLGIAHSTCDYIFNEKEKAVNDCKTLVQKLLQVKPELREWLEVNYKEYL